MVMDLEEKVGIRIDGRSYKAYSVLLVRPEIGDPESVGFKINQLWSCLMIF